jgi:D-amino-acid oxidase
MHQKSITVVGGGVSGLTTAVCLREAGFEANIIAEARYPSVVSNTAAAIWTTTAAEPAERARPWALRSRERFAELAEKPGTGVVSLQQRELERHEPGPMWWESTPFVRRMEFDELPPGFVAGFEIDGFMVEPPLYLSWLSARFRDLGGTLTQRRVADLAEVPGDLVVNCTGLGSRDLVGDDTLFAIRGQVVAVTNPGIRDGVADESNIERTTYVYPRSTEMVLGGARETGQEDLTPDAETTARILADCAALDPRVRSLDVLEVRVGLRPGRPTVRLEATELADGRRVIHNYGHSGAGFILSWGCGEEVARLCGGTSL